MSSDQPATVDVFFTVGTNDDLEAYSEGRAPLHDGVACSTTLAWPPPEGAQPCAPT